MVLLVLLSKIDVLDKLEKIKFAGYRIKKKNTDFPVSTSLANKLCQFMRKWMVGTPVRLDWKKLIKCLKGEGVYSKDRGAF